MISSPRLFLAACAVLCLSASTASAQWRNPYTGNTWNNPGASLIDTMLHGRLMQKLADRTREEKRDEKREEKRPARILYRPSGASRVAEEVAASVIGDKAPRAELTRALKAGMASFAEQAGEAGRKNDLGFALTFFIAGNYSVVKEQDVPDAATEALSRQIDEALGGIEAIAKAGDRQRQRLAEHLICATVLSLGGYQQGKQAGNAGQVALFRELAGQYLRTILGVDPGRLSITEAGLRQQ